MNSNSRHSIRWTRKSGQTLPIFVFFMVVLILFVGLGIDLGFAYITKANLSKAVDAAALEGMLAINQGTVTATAIAKSVFAANYGTPGRDTGVVTPNVVMSFDALGHRVISVDATANINTYFIRILPTWKTLAVSANAKSQSRRLIMSLVLDRSGSMGSDGGSTVLPPAVTNFVSYFDDANDYVSMNSFSKWATTDVTIRHNFKAPITTAVLAMTYNYNTISEQGMTNGLAQNESVVVNPGDDVIKVIVFFTDGLANGFITKLNCGLVNLSNPSGTMGTNNPTTGADVTGCTVPAALASIDKKYTGSANIDPRKCSDMHAEAEARALAIATLARKDGNIVYSVALNNGAFTECGGLPPLNTDFLKDMANTTDSDTYDATLPIGLCFIANTPSDIQGLFDKIRSDILLRLTQ